MDKNNEEISQQVNEATFNAGQLTAALNMPTTGGEAFEKWLKNVSNDNDWKAAKFAIALHPGYALSKRLGSSKTFTDKEKTKLTEWIKVFDGDDPKKIEQTVKSMIDNAGNPKGELLSLIKPLRGSDKATNDNIDKMVSKALRYLVSGNSYINDNTKKFVKISSDDSNTTKAIDNLLANPRDPEEKEGTETADTSNASVMELSVNKLIGRLHDTAIEAMKNKYGSLSNRIATFFGVKTGAKTAIINQGMTEVDGQSMFKGGNQVYQILVIPSGIFGKKQNATKALALYLKYFTGEDVDVSTDSVVKSKKDFLGKEMNIWSYDYKIVYKRYAGESMTESFKVIPQPKTTKNVWINENINPFNHKEPIRFPRFEKFIKAVDSGKNVEARQILESNLKNMAKTKIRATTIKE